MPIYHEFIEDYLTIHPETDTSKPFKISKDTKVGDVELLQSLLVDRRQNAVLPLLAIKPHTPEEKEDRKESL